MVVKQSASPSSSLCQLIKRFAPLEVVDLDIQVLYDFENEANLAEGFLDNVCAPLIISHAGPSCNRDRCRSRHYEIGVGRVSRVQLGIIGEVGVRIRPACIVIKTADQVVKIVRPVEPGCGAAISILGTARASCVGLGTAHSIFIVKRAMLPVIECYACMAIEGITCPQAPGIEGGELGLGRDCDAGTQECYSDGKEQLRLFHS